MKSLAVVGTGVAGMACAYFLRHKYQITVYEKNDYIGGHTNTVFIPENGDHVPVDTGFMVYNEHTYPNLIRFFEHLDIEAMDTSMSFSVNHLPSNFETSFTNLTTFFPTFSDLFEAERYKLLFGLKALFEKGKAYLANPSAPTQTLAQFVAENQIDPLVTEKFLLPMTAAIWSTPPQRMLDYPAPTLLRFLANHGMLGFGEQFQWKTLVGGSQQYKAKVLKKIGSLIQTSNGAARIEETASGVCITDVHGESETFDAVIIATHADQALGLLTQPNRAQYDLLSKFNYNTNPVALHTDTSVMPTKKRAWASWNYRYETLDDQLLGSVHYWMNRLQNVSESNDYIVSVDYAGPLDESKVKWRYVYEHPRFDEAAINAQPELPELNKSGPIYFCGSYFRYGFHEDAFTSALTLATQLNNGKDPLS